MAKGRKPEWTPPNAGKEYATRVLKATSTPRGIVKETSKKRSSFPTVDELVKGIKRGDRTLLAKAITLIESNAPQHFEAGQELIRRLLPDSGNSIRIGVTGMPGAGKSTFIENFGIWLLGKGHKVAVLAIDPSSTISRGSILGDKTRMEELSKHPGSFIRPSPSGGALGGVARKTRETIILCEAAGFDIVLIETVGVGQSEVTVRSMVDFFLLMQIPGAGDELQGIKKGVMELADLIVVNKADGENIAAAELACRELNNALHYLLPATPNWTTKAITCSAIQKKGIAEIWEIIEKFVEQGKSSGVFYARRKNQVLEWFESLIQEAVLNRFYSDAKVKKKLPLLKKQVEEGSLPVMLAVQQILEIYKV
ncbi:MAG: methylmalonyl Co-A mutase-associated GTPase MeaB [Candidatus Syntrophosphaera sp.]|jgi:LAO/AO transport system kinase|nr:methylmalonyl Co-A mutase-associated GTPase MeaB [Candidatus Cloacimonadota bacterium]MDY0111739.1 methylmalonyl Co-A mutase-associated GTPase MeaB [Candidatus Syntrophosphaera sp.]